jgi:formylglycine-generating enzyme required for sulfatase activity
VNAEEGERAKVAFLQRLEAALRRVICERLHEGADAVTRQELACRVEEFVRENASQYEWAELVQTFTSAKAAVGLFYEYQDAKRLAGEAGQDIAGPLFSATSPPLRRTGDLWREPTTGMEFVWVTGGCFEMGAGPWDDQGQHDELPLHEVWLDGFWIGRFPVTVEEYLPFAEVVPEHRPFWLTADIGVRLRRTNPYGTGSTLTDAGRFPVVGVSWHAARAFSAWLTRQSACDLRLPTEAQWEYAARSAGRAEKYAGGHPPDQAAWHAGNSGGRLHRVGRRAPNGLSLHDMCGNVCEWCLDVYDGLAYSRHAELNPLAAKGESGARVVRGGSFHHGTRDVRCADRGLFVPDYCGDDLGLRLVRLP